MEISKHGLTGTVKKTFNINTKSINKYTVSGLDNKIYTGYNITPVFISGLKKSTDYTVSYKNNQNVGTAQVIIKGIGNYSGQITKTFYIKPYSLNNSIRSMYPNEKKSYEYTGKAIKPKFYVEAKNRKELKKGTDYKITFKDNIKPGTATAIIKGIGNYTGTYSKTFKIEKASINKIGGSYFLKYTGKPVTMPSLFVGSNDVVLKKDIDYTVKYTNNVNIGTATVTVTGKGYYRGSMSMNFKIEE